MIKTIQLLMLLALSSLAVNNLEIRNLSGDPVATTEIYSWYKITGNYEKQGATASFLWWYDLNKNGKVEEDIDFCPIRRPEELHGMTITDGAGGGFVSDSVVDGKFSFNLIMRTTFAYPGNVIFFMEDNGVYDTIFYEAVYPAKTTGYCGQIKYADGTCGARLRIVASTEDIIDPIPGTPIQTGGAGAITDNDGRFCTYLKQDQNTKITMWVDDPMKLSNASFQQKFSNVPAAVANKTTDIGTITRNGSKGTTCGTATAMQKPHYNVAIKAAVNEIVLKDNAIIFGKSGNAEILIAGTLGQKLKHIRLGSIHRDERVDLDLSGFANTVVHIIAKVNDISRVFTIISR